MVDIEVKGDRELEERNQKFELTNEKDIIFKFKETVPKMKQRHSFHFILSFFQHLDDLSFNTPLLIPPDALLIIVNSSVSFSCFII